MGLRSERIGGYPLKLAFCWAYGRRKLIKAIPKSGSPIVDEALVRIATLYKIEDSIRGSDPEHRRAVRRDLSLPLVDAFFTWLAAQAKRISRKSDLGKAFAYLCDLFTRLANGHLAKDIDDLMPWAYAARIMASQ